MACWSDPCRHPKAAEDCRTPRRFATTSVGQASRLSPISWFPDSAQAVDLRNETGATPVLRGRMFSHRSSAEFLNDQLFQLLQPLLQRRVLSLELLDSGFGLPASDLDFLMERLDRNKGHARFVQ